MDQFPVPRLPVHDSGDGREDATRDDVGRVLRGGSWGRDQDHARAACRGGLDPGYRGDHLGFRVVCVSPTR